MNTFLHVTLWLDNSITRSPDWLPGYVHVTPLFWLAMRWELSVITAWWMRAHDLRGQLCWWAMRTNSTKPGIHACIPAPQSHAKIHNNLLHIKNSYEILMDSHCKTRSGFSAYLENSRNLLMFRQGVTLAQCFGCGCSSDLDVNVENSVFAWTRKQYSVVLILIRKVICNFFVRFPSN